jgi:2-alkenal reductase
MNDPRFRLLQTETDTKKSPLMWRGGRQTRTVATVALLALMLLVGALYGPMLMQTGTAAAVQPLQTQPISVPAMDASMAAQQDALASLFDAIVPSVVSIETAGQVSAMDLPPGFDPEMLPDGPVPQGQGSGWIFDNEGHIVTNNHVVEGADLVTVIFYDGTWADAEVVATDPQADLAVLKVTPPDGFPWQPLVLADEESVRVGHSVIAMGNPFGYASTMTTGIISALGRSFPVGGFGESRYTLPDVIQTDAAINPGNSGGPLLNLAGELVGVNFAIESAVRANSGVGFAIPVSIVERVVPALIADGSFSYPFLGLSGTSITPALARELELENTQLGAYVATVIPGGPAEAAGLVPADPDTNAGGDIIVSFNGERVSSFDDMVAALVTTSSPGDTVTLGVVRDGELIDVPVVVAERPTAVAQTLPSERSTEGELSAREAIDVAESAVAGELTGEIIEKVATPDEVDGKAVWVVELSTADAKAIVTVDRATGDIVEMRIQ